MGRRHRDRGRASRLLANANRCARRCLPRRVCPMVRSRMVHSREFLLCHGVFADPSSALPSISTADEPTRANVKSIPGSGEMSGAIVTAVEPTRANVKSLPGPGGVGPLGPSSALPSIATADEPTRANVKSFPGSGKMPGAVPLLGHPLHSQCFRISYSLCIHSCELTVAACSCAT